jgi:hypothetical protein
MYLHVDLISISGITVNDCSIFKKDEFKLHVVGKEIYNQQSSDLGYNLGNTSCTGVCI